MNKKKYIVPFCRTSVLDPEMLLAASEDEDFFISDEEGEGNAVLSNEQRPNSGSIWDKGW